MMNIDLTPYIDARGMVRIDDILRDHGFIDAEDILSTRIDTVAVAQILHISMKTLYTYINLKLIEFGPDRRMPLKKALKLDFKSLQHEAKLRKSVPINRQRRTNRTR